jgi:hypothetical protein
MLFWDTKYVLFVMLPGLLIGLWAQIKLHSDYGKYSQVPVDSGMTGAEAARRILDQAGLNGTPVEEIPGQLSDHYDPTKRALFLSSDIFHGRTIASVGVAAHEAGHTLQHLHHDALFNLRMALVPVTQFASYAWIGGDSARHVFAFPAHDAARSRDFFRAHLVPACDFAGGI